MSFADQFSVCVKGSVHLCRGGVRLEVLSTMAMNKRCRQTQGCIYYFCWNHPKNTSQAFQLLLSQKLVLKYKDDAPWQAVSAVKILSGTECAFNIILLIFILAFSFYCLLLYPSFCYFWLELCNSLSHPEPMLCWWLIVYCISDLHVFLLQNQYSTWILHKTWVLTVLYSVANNSPILLLFMPNKKWETANYGTHGKITAWSSEINLKSPNCTPWLIYLPMVLGFVLMQW